MKMTLLRPPFPWFGGKARVAHLVWGRFGEIRNYVEPFFGGGAVLLGRPGEPTIETVNDTDCYLSNFWRAVAADPDQVASFADWPVNEADLHARHRWLVETAAERVAKCKTDPDFFDAKVASWWVWGQCLWIGSGWCARPEWTGRVNVGREARGIRVAKFGKLPAIAGRDAGRGAYAKSRSGEYGKRPHLSSKGGNNGVHKPSLGAGAWQKRPVLQQDKGGRGVHRLAHQVPDLGGDAGAAGRGIHASGFLRKSGGLQEYMRALSDRLRRVRVCCGDFERVLGPAVTTCIGLTGVFLDPPYPEEGRAVCYNHDAAGDDLFAGIDLDVLPLHLRALEVARLGRQLHRLGRGGVWWRAYQWAIDNGSNPLLRIALCGYEHPDAVFPEGWSEIAWKASGGYGRSPRGKANALRERIWFSPGCINPDNGQERLW